MGSDSGWLDTSGVNYLTVEAQSLALLNCTLIVEAASYKEGPYNTPLITINSAYDIARAKATQEAAAANPLLRYVRCRVESTLAPWYICARVGARWG